MNNTVIDWFLPWPPQALLAVAETFLGEQRNRFFFMHIMGSFIFKCHMKGFFTSFIYYSTTRDSLKNLQLLF